ncbi:LuxR family transcriptional regulator [Nocardia ninae]|uniref:LuxR family transcriptional regulator n=1 Tax=Nocardia ninae NBRC 108245 TaxID=1210091 RepID=A0A511MDH8_9NOCA|nr:LuxR family transcriptional regulator [Nocardia ninae]GEM38714.1 LuxR family transcriptional regulator [Nocardia ninae NBRC 108245]
MSYLVGRSDETARLLALLQEARESRGGALLLLGEPGIGKSALLDHLAQASSGFLIMRASGAEFETELPYSALHQLCAPVLEHLDALPAPHRTALRIAFGLDTGTPDPFLAGAAALGLLLENDRPLLCLIDDAQWLDHASARALAFVARRIGAERVAMVFAAREDVGGLEQLPQVDVERLSESEARALLVREVPASLDERVRDRILAEARGNPLALLELPRTAGLAGMAGGFDLPAPRAAERSFRARLATLSPEVRLLLTVAAAEPVGDPGLLWPAAKLLGVEGAAAEDVSLVEFGTRVRFIHPLARSAVYQAATAAERRRAHGALAQVSDPVTDPDRVAWHRALASAGPDEEVATALTRSANRAQARGGVAAAAAFLERAAALTLDPILRSERVLAAVEAKLSVGDFGVAAELLSTLDSDDPRVDLLRGRISFARFRGGDQPTDHLLRAATRLADHDPIRSRECYVDAIEMSLLTGGFDAVIEAARTAPPHPQPPTSADLILDGMIALTVEGHQAAAKLLRPVVADGADAAWARWPTLGFLLALELWDIDAMRGIATRVTASGREVGSFHMLPIGLAMLATVTAYSGDFGAATAMISEEEAIAEATGAAPLVYPRIHLAALRGRRAEAEELFAGVGPHMTLSVQYATAVLNNSLADYPAAMRAAERAVATGDLGLAGQALPELVEAAVRCHEPDVARTALATLTERAGGHPFGLGIQTYARALVDDDEDSYRRAVSLLDSSTFAVAAGRAHLVYGEWLRRQGRRRDARTELRHAHEVLAALGAEAFAARAAGELRATGEHTRSRSADVSDALTVQEVHIARLVAEGATSKEVAAKLFLSPRTVDAHLRNIFRKLGITSRRQLRDLPDLR